MRFIKRLKSESPLLDIRKGELSDIEKTGDPFAIAASHLNTGTTKEVMPIGPPRASKLYDGCMRFHVLGSKFNVKQTQWCDFKGNVVFGFGNAVHYWAQNEPDLLGGNRYGYWRCSACKKFSRPFGPFPKKKCSCGASKDSWIYFEYCGKCKQPEFTYHIDMFIKVHNLYRILDFKTMKGEDFEKLKAPLISHVYQVTAYVMGCSQSSQIPKEFFDTQLAYVLYISKQYHSKHLPVKMFPVKISKRIIDDITEKANSYSECIKHFPNRMPPVHSECVSGEFGNYRANTCPVRRRCVALHKKNEL